MNPVFYIARRFAFKQRSASKPTFIVMVAVIGIAVGTAALILTLSIVQGFAVSVENKLISFSSHLQVRHPEEQLFQERRSDLSKVKDNGNVSGASPFLEKSFVLRCRSTADGEDYRSKPVVIKGISEEQQQVFLKKFLKSGKLLPVEERDKRDGIALYLGQTLAENLGLSVGANVMLVGLGSQSSSSKLIVGNKSIVDLLSSVDLEVGVIRGIYDTN